MYKSILFRRDRRVRWVMAPLALFALGMLLAAPQHNVTAGSEYIDDGGFEAGVDSGNWNEKSTNFGTPICSLAICGSGAGTAGARTGSFWAWFGGASTTAEKGSLTQKVKFPAGGKAKLRFYLWIGDTSDDGKDWVKVLVDGQKVFKAKETQGGNYPSYTLVQKKLDQFADGAKHKVQFKNKCSGDGNSNFNIDDISIMVE